MNARPSHFRVFQLYQSALPDDVVLVTGFPDLCFIKLAQYFGKVSTPLFLWCLAQPLWLVWMVQVRIDHIACP